MELADLAVRARAVVTVQGFKVRIISGKSFPRLQTEVRGLSQKSGPFNWGFQDQSCVSRDGWRAR